MKRSFSAKTRSGYAIDHAETPLLCVCCVVNRRFTDVSLGLSVAVRTQETAHVLMFKC
jgi:hypothetical protein